MHGFTRQRIKINKFVLHSLGLGTSQLQLPWPNWPPFLPSFSLSSAVPLYSALLLINKICITVVWTLAISYSLTTLIPMEVGFLCVIHALSIWNSVLQVWRNGLGEEGCSLSFICCITWKYALLIWSSWFHWLFI